MAEARSELILPSDPGAPRLARVYVQELGSQAGLPAQAAETLAAAVEQAIGDIRELAFEPGDQRTISLVGTLSPAMLTLSVHERGLPFDPARALPTGSTGSAPAGQAPIRPDTWARLSRAVDQTHWLGHGKAGMELRLVKQQPQGDVTTHLPAAALTPFAADEPRAPEQQYTIRRLHPDEAIQVAQLVYRAYGYSYGNGDLYYPARIAHLNATGQLVSVVAVDETGAVVGHLALERPDGGSIAESGEAVVAPAHRGRHLLERMRAFAEEEGRRLGLEGLYGYPVTSHVYSQRMEERFGAHVCAVTFASMPRSTRFKHIRSQPLPQRESNLLYFKYLAPPPVALACAPEHHRPILERIYAELCASLELRPPEPTAGDGELAVVIDHAWQFAELRVHRVGTNTATQVRQAVRDLRNVAAGDVIVLQLPLAQGGTPDLCRAAETDGFFFAGVGPRFAPDGDALLLQYLRVPLDPALLQIASPSARELVAYAAAERARVVPSS